MKILLWLRCLRCWNWYNWNLPKGTTEVVVYDLANMENFNVGQRYQIMSVNRGTGMITGQWV